MVSGAQPTHPHATSHTLHHALGNLGGRQKSWMLPPSNRPVPPPALLPFQPVANPAPSPPVRRLPQPHKDLVDNRLPGPTLDTAILPRPAYQPEHQQTFISPSLQPPNTAAHGPGIPAVFPSPTLTDDVASAAASAQSCLVNSNNVVLASTRIQTTGALETPQEPAGIDSVHAERVTQNSTNEQAQQTPRRRGRLPKNSGQTKRPALCSPWYTRQTCLDVIYHFQSSVPASSSHATDRVRMAVLRDAIDKQDWAYLTMHQCYCMLSTCPGDLPNDLRSLPALPHALKMLHDVLQPNQTLSPPILYFFSNFPYPMGTIRAKWGPSFQHQMYLFSLFVSRSPNYEQLRQVCDLRRYPPLAQELSVTLGIASVTFQRLAFTACLRYIWRSIPQTPLFRRFEAQALAVFQQNQDAQPHPQFGPAAPLSHEQIISNQACSLKLREIIEQHGVALRESSLQSASPYQQQRPHQSQGNFALHSISNGQMSQLPAQPVVHRIHGFGQPPSAPSNTLPRPATTLPQPAPILPSSPAQSHKASQRLLLPPSGRKQPQQRVPNPSRYSLHQADLRSPTLCAPSDSPPLYVFHEGYIKPPTRLSVSSRTIETWTFTMTREEIQVLCKTASQSMGAPGTRNIDENSKLASLRCIKWNQGVEMPKEDVWAMTETSWIPYLYINLNDKPLQARKKLHHGKDLPIDVTDLLREGENVLKMTVISESDDTFHLNHLIAIETIGVVGHENIKQQCLNQRRVSAEEVLQSIKDKLSGSGNDDDEISIVQSSITIGLREPFSQAKMCDIPVRSRACLHNDCFDFDIFLQSRPRTGDASVADQWKCPICGVDARPHMLLHDGFIELVKQQLEAQGLTDTRYIIVQQDGSWKPKPEAAEGTATSTCQSSADRLSTPTSAHASTSRRSSAVEVIDLSD